MGEKFTLEEVDLLGEVNDLIVAISDPIRLRMVEFIIDNEGCYMQKVIKGIEFQMSRKSASKHFQILERCGLIKSVRKAREKYLNVDPAAFELVKNIISEYRENKKV